MIKTLFAAIILIGAGVFAMCFNIIFRKKEFPVSDVGSNENMRRLGIRCMKEIDAEIFDGRKKKDGAVCTGTYSDACSGCGLYKTEKQL